MLMTWKKKMEKKAIIIYRKWKEFLVLYQQYQYQEIMSIWIKQNSSLVDFGSQGLKHLSIITYMLLLF